VKAKTEIERYSILLLASAIPFPVRITGFLFFVIMVLYFIYLLAFRRFDIGLLRNPLFLLLTISFAILLIGYTWGDHNSGLMELERGLFLLGLPFVIYHSAKKSGLDVGPVIIWFFIGCFLVSIVGWLHIIWSEDYSILLEGHARFTEPLDVHPTYLSSFFILTFFYFLESFRGNIVYSFNRKIAYGMAGLYSFLMIFFLRSQIAMLSFVILLLIYFIIRRKRRAWFVAFVLFTIVFLTYLFDARRVSTFFDRYGKNVSTALDDRVELWSGVLEAIKISPVIGAGTGAEQQLINKGYEKVGYTEGIEYSYNAHNQYLQFWVRNGLAELTCFLTLLVVLFLQALKLRSFTFLIFLMTVSMIMFTESFLSVQKGIVFFYFFACVFTMIPEGELGSQQIAK
jgi:O-antigen ligase